VVVFVVANVSFYWVRLLCARCLPCLVHHSIRVSLFAVVDLEWKVMYVGSAEDSRHDQILEDVLVGPVPDGVLFYRVNHHILQKNPRMTFWE